MANRSVTITARIKAKDEVSSESVATQPGESVGVYAVDEPMTMPNTKA